MRTLREAPPTRNNGETCDPKTLDIVITFITQILPMIPQEVQEAGAEFDKMWATTQKPGTMQ